MSEANVESTMVHESDSIAVNRLEAWGLAGAVVAGLGLLLPWVNTLSGSASGLTFSLLSPVFAGAVVLAALLALSRGYDRERFAAISLLGVLFGPGA